jgi:hypothetical protein
MTGQFLWASPQESLTKINRLAKAMRGETLIHSLLSNSVFFEIARRLRKAMIHQILLPLSEIPLRIPCAGFGEREAITLSH